MKKCYLFLVLLLPVAALAQTNYKPGYVVGLKGDTIKGSIDYREWGKNPKQVTIKSNAGAVQQFTAHNAKAFAVTNLEYYETDIVSVSTDVVDINRFAARSDSDFVKDTVFLKVLARGKNLTLYSYTDGLKPRYYFAETGAGTSPEELAYHLSFRSNSTSDIQYVRRYRTQLQFEAEKFHVAGLDNLIGRAMYESDDLVRIVSKINGEAYQQMVSQSQFGARWFVGAGGSYNGMNFKGVISFGNAYSLLPSFSVGLDLLPNKDTQQLFFRVELSGTSANHEFQNTSTGQEVKITQNTASFTPQAYYSFYNGQKLKVFAGGGLAVNVSTYPIHYYGAITSTPPTAKQNTAVPDYHTVWESFILKGGVILNKKVELYAAYSPSSTLTNNYGDFSGSVVIYQAGVNFLFGAK